jgi:peptide deformylase
MWETVKGEGIGLAAPQVGFGKKICIIHLSEDGSGRGKESPKKDFVMINPVITFKSQVKNSMVEGCLSFPEEFYEILRPANIEVEYFDEKGKKKKLKAKGWLSRVIQHEVDHLEGEVFTKLGGRKLSKEELEGQGTEIVD